MQSHAPFSRFLTALSAAIAIACGGPQGKAGGSGAAPGSGSGGGSAQGGANGAGGGPGGSGGPNGGGPNGNNPSMTIPVTGIDPPANLAPGIVGPVSGTLSADTVWGPGDVTLTENVFVPAGVTLTINPGTNVSGVHGIDARGGGKLVCQGYFNAPVMIFESWIYLEGGQHSFQYCIMNSQGDTAVDVNGAELSAYHFQLQRFNDIGIHVRGPGAKVSIDFSTLGSHSKLFTLENVEEEGVSVLIAADAAMAGSSITNSILGFLHNASNTGLRIEGASSNTHLAYDMISGPRSTITSSDVTDVRQGMPEVTDIPNLDYHENYFSSVLDIADPRVQVALEPAPNGGRTNLGYYGGTPGARITSVEVSAPNGCEEFAAGATTTIHWRSSPNTGPKTLAFSADNGSSWSTLANVTTDTGSAQVALPNVQTDQALIGFSQDNNPEQIRDVSNRVFAVGAPKSPTACSTEVRCPAGTQGCKYFNVIGYTGYREGQEPTDDPETEPSYQQVLEDLQILAGYTHGIRTYGSNPVLHNGQYVPGIADMLGLDLHMGVWVDFSYSDQSNHAAIDDALAIVAQNHPSIRTLIVGNEFLLRVRQSFGDTQAAEAKLVSYIQYARERAPQQIEVVTAESYVDWLTASGALFGAVDRVIWHVHPWWQQHALDTAVNHVENAHSEMLARMAEVGVNKPELLGETGYPWGECNGPDACGSEQAQAQYLQALHDYSGRTGLEYWFFEGFDEPWKSAEGAVGGKWGIWKGNRTPHLVISDIANRISSDEMWAP